MTPQEAWQRASFELLRLSPAYAEAVEAEPIARDYGDHWGFFPTQNGSPVPDSVPIFVDKATGTVLTYGSTPEGGFLDYIGPEPAIPPLDSIPVGP